MHEMNGNWYPWCGTVNGNNAALYRTVWIRIRKIFRKHAPKVKFVWSPNNIDFPNVARNKFEKYYPGDEYVDVLGFDAYNWGSTRPEFGGWKSFSKIALRTYNRLKTLSHRKPIWIAEVGSAPEGGNKAAWIRNMFHVAKSLPQLKAILYFNLDKEEKWGIWDPKVAAAFKSHTSKPKPRPRH